VYTDIRPDRVFLQTPSHERFPVVKLGGFSLAMPLKAGVLATAYWAESLTEEYVEASRVVRYQDLVPSPFRNRILFLKPYCQPDMGHQAHSLYCNRRIRSRRSDPVSRCTPSTYYQSVAVLYLYPSLGDGNLSIGDKPQRPTRH
jgi:hypothetical protein